MSLILNQIQVYVKLNFSILTGFILLYSFNVYFFSSVKTVILQKVRNLGLKIIQKWMGM